VCCLIALRGISLLRALPPCARCVLRTAWLLLHFLLLPARFHLASRGLRLTRPPPGSPSTYLFCILYAFARGRFCVLLRVSMPRTLILVKTALAYWWLA